MKKLGRVFNHVEDLTFFYGSAGAREALQHLTEICESPHQLRMKWDGGCQVYWGRDDNNNFVMASHNSWARGVAAYTAEDMETFIADNSGTKSEQRDAFAKQYSQLFGILEQVTPLQSGFYYADVLFYEKQLQSNSYDLYPNSKTGYHIKKNTTIGQIIPELQALMVCHGFFDEFGEPDSAQQPISFEYSKPPIVILPAYYNKTVPFVNFHALDHLINISDKVIDEFLQPIAGVSAFKDYLYQYSNYKAKRYELDTLGQDFEQWVSTSKLSSNQKSKILARNSETNGASILFNVVNQIRMLKNTIIDQLETTIGDIKVTNPEGWVRYADTTKQFGNIKLVPRHTWQP
jgi:hypothetical protein